MRAVAVLTGLSILTVAHLAWGGPLDKPPFTATPQELLAEAKAVAGTDADVVVLRDDMTTTYDDAGRAEHRYRVVGAILKPAAVDSWGTLAIDWKPFYQERPTIRARVISRDGTVAEIDPSLFHDAPTVSESPSVFSDRRELEAPLPRLAVGAVFEEEFVIKDREPLLAEGTVDRFYPGRGVPVQRTVITIDAPAKRPPTIVTRGFAKPPVVKQRTSGGRTTWTYDIGALPAEKPYEAALPGDVSQYPYVGVATGKSWGAIAAGYRRLVEDKLKTAVALPADVKAGTPRATVDRAVAWLHAHVRYTGIELRDSAIVPFTPAETMKRGFGDCKDKATLLVAMLRAAGITADVAILATGPGNDVDQALPGMGPFDHAIVRAKVDGKDLWIDATEDGLPAGQLPIRDQGRLALIIAPGASALTMTPVPRASDNLVREVRTFTLAEADWATAREVSTEHGIYGNDLRSWFRDSKRADITKSLGEYAERQYAGELISVRGDDPGDVTKPFSLVLEIGKVRRAYTNRTEAEAYLFSTDTLGRLPKLVTTEGTELEREAKERTGDYVWAAPHVYEIENRLIVPVGHTPPAIAAATEKRALGSMTLTTTRRLDKGVFVVTFRLDTGPRRITAAQLRATRAAVLALRKESSEHVVMPQTGAALLDAGKIDEAIAEYQRLIALHPKEGLHHGQLAEAYSVAGMGAAARRSARRRVELDPTDSDAYVVLALQLRRDSVGRDLGFDADRTGAIAAYRKALTLNPTHHGALEGLAWLLTVDEHGWANHDPREIAEAVELWRRLEADTESDSHDFSIGEKLFDLGRFAEAETLARELPRSDEGQGLQVAAVAGARGPAAALTLARTLASGAARVRVLSEARARLLRIRRYDLMRELHAEIAKGGSSPQDAMMGALKVIDLDRLPANEPRTAVIHAIRYTVGLEPTLRPWTREVDTLLLEGARAALATGQMNPMKTVPEEVVLDMFVAMSTMAVDGDARTGWHVALNLGGMRMFYYLRSTKGRPEVIGASGTSGSMGNEIMARLAAKDLAGARRWVERFAEDLERISTPQSPLVQAVGIVYREEIRASSTPPRDALELAAALLLAENDEKAALPALRRCPVKNERVKKLCANAAVGVLMTHKAWKEAAEAAAALSDDADDEPLRAMALVAAGRGKEALERLDRTIAAAPRDVNLITLRAHLTIATDGIAKAEPWLERAVAHPDVSARELNAVAWTLAFHDSSMTRALELARRGEKLSTPLVPALANTLAVIEAQAGHPHAARRYLLASHVRLPFEPPIEDDWYAYGRIAEHLGLKDDAIAAYRRVLPRVEQPGVAATSDFAERALERLGATAAPAPARAGGRK